MTTTTDATETTANASAEGPNVVALDAGGADTEQADTRHEGGRGTSQHDAGTG